jgi:hypothetical protein
LNLNCLSGVGLWLLVVLLCFSLLRVQKGASFGRTFCPSKDKSQLRQAIRRRPRVDSLYSVVYPCSFDRYLDIYFFTHEQLRSLETVDSVRCRSIPETFGILLSQNIGHKKSPNIFMFGLYKSGIDLLSHPQKGSTISANGLNFSVRNGKRWTSLQ